MPGKKSEKLSAFRKAGFEEKYAYDKINKSYEIIIKSMAKKFHYNKREIRIIGRIAREIRKFLEESKMLHEIFSIGHNEEDAKWKKFFDSIAYEIFNENRIHIDERGYLFNAAIKKIKEDIWSEQKERKEFRKNSDPQQKLFENKEVSAPQDMKVLDHEKRKEKDGKPEQTFLPFGKPR